MKFFRFLLLFFTITGCTVGPDYQKPDPKLPAHYSVRTPGDSAKKVNRFWSDAPGDPVLASLIQQALQGNNLDIQKSYATIHKARAELGIAKADYYPQVELDGKISRDRLSSNSEIVVAFPRGIIPLSYTDYKAGFDASWEIDLFGHTRRSVEASLARFQSAIENQQDVAISIAAEVANIYTQYRIYQQRIAIARQTIASYTKTAKLVRLQMQAGSAAKVDLSRVESEVLSSEASLPPLYAESKATLAALSVLVGEFPESLFTKLSAHAPIPVIHPRYLSVGLPSDLLKQRPDIKMAERNLAAACADIGVARANQFPRFSLMGDIGSDTTIPGAFFQAASRYWSVGPQIALPVFQGGRLVNALTSSVAAFDIALADYKKSVLQALADVESSLVRYERERMRHQKIRAAHDALKSALRLVRLQYQSGKVSLIDVLDVERQLHQLEDQQAQSQGQVTINLVSLYKALGGDWLKNQTTT